MNLTSNNIRHKGLRVGGRAQEAVLTDGFKGAPAEETLEDALVSIDPSVSRAIIHMHVIDEMENIDANNSGHEPHRIAVLRRWSVHGRWCWRRHGHGHGHGCLPWWRGVAWWRGVVVRHSNPDRALINNININ